MKIRKLAYLSIITISLSGFAQESAIYTNPSKNYLKALELYNERQYQASQRIFSEVQEKTTDIETKANCSYYIANAAIRLNQLGAERLMENFVDTYPTSTKRNSAFIDVANYYFDQGKYANALKWFDKAEDQSMSYSERETFNFKKGYSLFKARKYKDAKSYLNQVITSEEYGSQAKYYIGYIAYESDNYGEADSYFSQVSGNDNLNDKLSYYQADMNFKKGDFKKAIALAQEQLPKADPKEKSELNKIIGESYFNLQQYNEAIPYLKEYKGKSGKWNNVDFYQLGYAYYKQNDFENAIGQFNKIIDGNDPVAQNAYYHLAECYIKTDKKQQALNAFKNASQMNFEAQIQKDAALNYAKLSYEIGNPYENVPQVLTNYIDNYPDSPNKQEIQELLVDSYITSKNYDAALELLEKNRNFSSKTTYQKVAFYRGLELFNDGNYQEAIDYFDKSLKEAQDQSFTARATFWNAEADYILNKYSEAVVGFKQFEQNSASTSTPEYKHLFYNLGYAYFKQKNYDQAIAYFKKYTTKEKQDLQRLNDAYLRLGDSHFVTSKYWPAMEFYNQAITLNEADTDYAHFQKAISYGFVDRTSQKIDELEKFVSNYPKSTLRDDAYYELGNTYVNNNQTSKGIAAYNKLAEEYRMSSYVPKAILKEGLVYYNGGQNSDALIKFKQVVKNYPDTQEAVQAVSTAKMIYVDEGRVNEYANWVKQLDFVEISDSEIENAAYESAERKFVQGETKASIKGFEDYLKQFPNGGHALNANFYLAQSYFNTGEPEKSIPHYKNVIKDRNEFTEQALARLSQIYIDNEQKEAAIPVLKQLETQADYPQNITFAQSNLMKINYDLGNYSETLTYAKKVLSNPKIDNRIKSDAQIMIARSAIKTNNEDLAKTAYQEVQKIATGALAAEALYYDAYFKNKDGLYEASNTAVQKLAKDYAGYKEFGAKGLIIMAKNFHALDDAFQATYILENVITNFATYSEIVEEAETELQKIKTQESLRNSSVSPNDQD